MQDTAKAPRPIPLVEQVSELQMSVRMCQKHCDRLTQACRMFAVWAAEEVRPSKRIDEILSILDPQEKAVDPGMGNRNY